MAANIENAFNTDNMSVHNYMSQSGQGLYIPLYQREYSWDDDNITQLLEDITKGIVRIIEGNSEEIRFLGTIITVKENNRNKLYPVDPQAIPACVEKIIDGQQRLSTIAALGCVLCKKFNEIKYKVRENNPIYSVVDELCNHWEKRLLDIISFDLNRGNPSRKPKIIRGSIDFWTKDKPNEDAYRSPVSRLLADTISAYYNGTEYPTVNKEIHGIRLTANVKKMESWVKQITRAHKNDDDDYPTAKRIIDSFDPAQIIMYDRDGSDIDFKKIIHDEDENISSTNKNTINELVELCATCNYLLDRCCFTIIQPTNDDWAFDMFQSLNATGTPLTAIETFKPLVVNYTNENGSSYKGSRNEKSMDKVELLFENLQSAQQKSKLTNDFLTSFYVAYNGSSLSSHFSHQRKALMASFEEKDKDEDKIAFLDFFGEYADFYKNIWLDHDFKEKIEVIKNDEEGELITLLISFLKESKHKMAISVLASFYSQIGKTPTGISDFICATKTTLAFYILWRSTGSNAGLDNVYRELFKKNGKEFKSNASLSIEELKSHFKEALIKRETPEDFTAWAKIAALHLTYDEAAVICKLLLFIAFDDSLERTSDNNVGLIKKGRSGSNPFLTLDKWNSSDLKTVEHIAPQSNNSDWDVKIYDTDKPLVHTLGNLTLLPQNINSSAGNKGWDEKNLYYKCISTKEQEEIDRIQEKACSLGITLNETTVELLRNCQYNSHMNSITLRYDRGYEWDADIIQRRTECILKLAWDTISNWL